MDMGGAQVFIALVAVTIALLVVDLWIGGD